MIVDVTNIVGPDAAQYLSRGNLHKVAAAQTGVPEVNLKTAMQIIFTDAFYKNAMWSAIATGLTSLSKIETDQKEKRAAVKKAAEQK